MLYKLLDMYELKVSDCLEEVLSVARRSLPLLKSRLLHCLQISKAKTMVQPEHWSRAWRPSAPAPSPAHGLNQPPDPARHSEESQQDAEFTIPAVHNAVPEETETADKVHWFLVLGCVSRQGRL